MVCLFLLNVSISVTAIFESNISPDFNEVYKKGKVHYSSLVDTVGKTEMRVKRQLFEGG